MKYLILLIILVSCSKVNHPNGSVDDRLRHRHVKVSPNNHHIKKKYAPVKTHNPSIK